MISKFLKFFGIKIVPQITTTASEMGEIEVITGTGKAGYHNGVSVSPFLTEEHSATVTNKDINADQNNIINIDNNEIKALAGIEVSKLEALTADKAVQTDSDGFLESSTTTSTQLGYLDSTTSNIQDQLNAKLDDFASVNNNRIVRTDGTSGNAIKESAVTLDDSGNMSGVGTLGLSGPITDASLNANRALASDSLKRIVSSTTTDTELGYVSGVSSGIQGQLDGKVNDSGDTMSGDLSMGGNSITSLADPLSATDAANKQYVDAVASGLSLKDSVRAATTVAGTLASSFENGDTIDGVVLVTNNRILIKNQVAPEENGIYTVNASGAPSRSTDADTFAKLVSAFTFVEEGTVNADTGWVCTSNAGGTINVDPITFTQFSGAGTVTTDGEGIEISGNQLSLELDGTTLSKSGSGLKVATNGITNNEVDSSAAIARSKLASGSNNYVVINNGSGVMSEEQYLDRTRGGTGITSTATFPASGTVTTDGGTSVFTNKTYDADGTGNVLTNIDDGNIKVGAAITRSKLANGSANHVVINDGSGVLSSEAQLALSRGGSAIDNSQTNDSTTTGSSATLNAVTGHVRLTNASLASLAMIPAPASGGIKFTLYNDTGNTISLLNDSGGTAANRIYTGTGSTLAVASQACVSFVYDGTDQRWLVVGGSGSGSGSSTGIIKVRYLDVYNTTLPTGAVVIDGQAIVNGDRVLFTELLADNNQIYEATEAGGSVSAWTAQADFEGSSVTPSDIDIVGVKEGDYYSDNIVVYNDTEFVNLLNNKVSLTLTDNVAATTFLEIDTTKYSSMVMEYSISRGTTLRVGEYWAGSINSTADNNDFGNVIIGDTGVTFSAAMSGTILQIKYATTSTGSNATLKKTIRIW